MSIQHGAQPLAIWIVAIQRMVDSSYWLINYGFRFRNEESHWFINIKTKPLGMRFESVNANWVYIVDIVLPQASLGFNARKRAKLKNNE